MRRGGYAGRRQGRGRGRGNAAGEQQIPAELQLRRSIEEASRLVQSGQRKLNHAKASTSFYDKNGAMVPLGGVAEAASAISILNSLLTLPNCSSSSNSSSSARAEVLMEMGEALTLKAEAAEVEGRRNAGSPFGTPPTGWQHAHEVEQRSRLECLQLYGQAVRAFTDPVLMQGRERTSESVELLLTAQASAGSALVSAAQCLEELLVEEQDRAGVPPGRGGRQGAWDAGCPGRGGGQGVWDAGCPGAPPAVTAAGAAARTHCSAASGQHEALVPAERQGIWGAAIGAPEGHLAAVSGAVSSPSLKPAEGYGVVASYQSGAATAAMQPGGLCASHALARARRRGEVEAALCSIFGRGASPESLLREARDRFHTVLSAMPDATESLLSLGTCCFELAHQAPFNQISSQPLPGTKTDSEASSHFHEAQSAFQTALASLTGARAAVTELCDLLHAWGVGISAVAKAHTSPQEAITLCQLAAGRLREAAKLQPLDVRVRLALGDVLCTESEQLLQLEHKDEAVQTLSVAVSEGYDAALKIDSHCAEAQLGKGDACLDAARVCGLAGNEGRVKQLLDQSISAFDKAMEELREGRWFTEEIAYSDQCSAIFNQACARALRGQAKEAEELLVHLAASGWLMQQDLGDSDLLALRGGDLFQSIQQRCCLGL